MDSNSSSFNHLYTGIWDLYAGPFTASGPFIIGLLVGQFLEKIKLNFRCSSTVLRNTFMLALIVAIATIYGILPQYWYPKQGNNIYNILYTALFRTVFSSAIAVMIIAFYLNDKR